MGSWVTKVIAMTTLDKQPEPSPPKDDLPFDELARRRGVTPVESLAELAQPDLWESDGEYEAFLADLYASRRAVHGVTPVVLDVPVERHHARPESSPRPAPQKRRPLTSHIPSRSLSFWPNTAPIPPSP